jgi:hypothetical protein
MQPTELSDGQLTYLIKSIFLDQRAKIVSTLLDEGILESNNGVAGFWRGHEWVSVYDILGETFG